MTEKEQQKASREELRSVQKAVLADLRLAAIVKKLPKLTRDEQVLNSLPRKVHVPRKDCRKCGERIRGEVYRFDKQTFCGLCMDDVLNALGGTLKT